VGPILVVEDDAAVAALIAEILAQAELEAVCVRTDADAHAALAASPFRALVVDVNLGRGATGYDVARFARRAIPNLPVVYVSGEASPETFHAAGVPDSDFLLKPFGAAELLATLQARLARAGR
jgi:two-component system, cell cycle response regulator CpdR